MRITLDVPFYVGQKVWQAVYSYANDRGERKNIISDWVVVGYKLDEFGNLFCICQRIQGEVKRIEYLAADRLYASEAELHLIRQPLADTFPSRGRL
jgi:hypothetical protein